MSRKTKPPKDFDENLEWTKEDFARAIRIPVGTKLTDLGKLIAQKRGRPKLDQTKK